MRQWAFFKQIDRVETKLLVVTVCINLRCLRSKMSLPPYKQQEKLKSGAQSNEHASLLDPTAGIANVEHSESSSRQDHSRFRRAADAGYQISRDATSIQSGFRSSDDLADNHAQFQQSERALAWNYPYRVDNPYYGYSNSQPAHPGYLHEDTAPHVFGPQPQYHLHPDHVMPPTSYRNAYYDPSNVREDGRTGSESHLPSNKNDDKYAHNPSNYSDDKGSQKMALDPMLLMDKKQRADASFSRSSTNNSNLKTILSSNVTRVTNNTGTNNDGPEATSSLVASVRRRGNPRGAVLRSRRMQRLQEERVRVLHFRKSGMTQLAERLLSPGRFQELLHTVRAREEAQQSGDEKCTSERAKSA